MTQADFDMLARYDCSFPSGAYEGKMWASVSQDETKLLYWYGNSEKEGYVSNNRRRVTIVGAIQYVEPPQRKNIACPKCGGQLIAELEGNTYFRECNKCNLTFAHADSREKSEELLENLMRNWANHDIPTPEENNLKTVLDLLGGLTVYGFSCTGGTLEQTVPYIKSVAILKNLIAKEGCSNPNGCDKPPNLRADCGCHLESPEKNECLNKHCPNYKNTQAKEEPPCGDQCPKDEHCDNFEIDGKICPHAPPAPAVPSPIQPVLDRWDAHKNVFQIPAADIRALIDFARTYDKLMQVVNDMGHFQCYIKDGVAHFKRPSSADKVNAVPSHVREAFDRLIFITAGHPRLEADLKTIYNYMVR
jgi:hypothetical protein